MVSHHAARRVDPEEAAAQEEDGAGAATGPAEEGHLLEFSSRNWRPGRAESISSCRHVGGWGARMDDVEHTVPTSGMLGPKQQSPGAEQGYDLCKAELQTDGQTYQAVELEMLKLSPFCASNLFELFSCPIIW